MMPDSKAASRCLHESRAAWVSFEAACVLGVATLIAAHIWRFLFGGVIFDWTSMSLVLIAWAAADFVTGIVHWAADTWGAEGAPFWGPRFLRPFRVHHVTPRSFLEFGFFDTNGDTAMLCIPVLLAVFLIPLDSLITANFALFFVAFCVFAAPTNQIHQWAHMDRPPRLVRWLQRAKLILSPQEHGLHHRHPHVTRYCISSGICNPMLDRMRFFSALEWVITKLTGVRPRYDEHTNRTELLPTPKASVDADANVAARHGNR